MYRLGKGLFLFAIGGSIYALIELIYKSVIPTHGTTHWSMFVVGGIMFLAVGGINEFIPWEMPLLFQGIIGAAMITVTELLMGLYLNVYLGLGVWNYSHFPLNLCGQICLPFSLLWILLAMVAVVLDDFLLYCLFDGERPHYKML